MFFCLVFLQDKERPGDQRKVEKEAEEKKESQQTVGAEKTTSHSFRPFPPPPHLGSEVNLHLFKL